jgi:hypothetical protein
MAAGCGPNYCNADGQASVERLSAQTGTWTRLPNMAFRRTRHTLTLVTA